MGWFIGGLAVIVVIVFLKNTGKMKKLHTQIRNSYLKDGLEYEEAEKVAWYLIDVFIYLRNEKDPKLARTVLDLTMNIFYMRLHEDDAYENQFAAQTQVDLIRDACLIYNRPAIETADTIYSSIIARLPNRTNE